MTNALAPMHPGELLREDILPALGKTVIEIAELLGVSRQSLHAVLAGRAAVSPSMALRLAKLCGNDPEFWLALQAKWDLAAVAPAMAEELAQIPTLHEAA